MQDLMKIENNKVYTSLDIAGWAGKEHFNVLNDVRDESEKLGEKGSLIFQATSYTDSCNRQKPMFVMGSCMDKLIPIEHKNQRILTTTQLAEVYETSENNIKNNFNRNTAHFQEGKHYYKLEGAELKAFKNEVTNSDFHISPTVNCFYLWTEKGASRHCKILDTDKAWERFDELEDTYFKVKEQQPSIETLVSNPDLLIAMATEVKKLQEERDEAVRTKALIGSKREATAMAKAEEELGRSKEHATIKAVQIKTKRKLQIKTKRKFHFKPLLF